MISLKEQLVSRLSSHVPASPAADHARCSAASLERLLDETDEYCRTHLKREDGEEMFKKVRDRRGELPPSVQEIVGILPADIDVEKVYREHLEEKYR